MSKFILKCECGEEAVLEGYKYTGNLNDGLLTVEIEVNEDDHQDIKVKFDCNKCGNHFYIDNF